MAKFQINYLGCGSATPTFATSAELSGAGLSRQSVYDWLWRGAQLSMRRQRLKFSRLSHIFISHLHGDHCLGLPGLVSTLALTGREGGDITIHTFKEGVEIFKTMLDFSVVKLHSRFTIMSSIREAMRWFLRMTRLSWGHSRYITACHARDLCLPRSQSRVICEATWCGSIMCRYANIRL